MPVTQVLSGYLHGLSDKNYGRQLHIWVKTQLGHRFSHNLLHCIQNIGLAGNKTAFYEGQIELN